MKNERVDYANYFMREIETKYTGKNIFKRFKCWRSHRKFIANIRTWSPSIGMLWFFADFIKLSERIYFYDNRKNGRMFSSDGYTYGENGFIINSEHDKLQLTCKLYSDTQKVVIQIKRLNGTNMVTEHVFVDNQWTLDKEKYDEVLIDNVIGIINCAIIELVEYCWDHRGSYDYGLTDSERKSKRKAFHMGFY